MKSLTLFIALFFSAGVVAKACAFEDVEGLIGNGSKILILKADKEFVGGKVLVYGSNQNLIFSQKMRKRKLSIDFSVAMIGVYTVRLVNGNKEQEYHFLKK